MEPQKINLKLYTLCSLPCEVLDLHGTSQPFLCSFWNVNVYPIHLSHNCILEARNFVGFTDS
jgi:hypothetical protein